MSQTQFFGWPGRADVSAHGAHSRLADQIDLIGAPAQPLAVCAPHTRDAKYSGRNSKFNFAECGRVAHHTDQIAGEHSVAYEHFD